MGAPRRCHCRRRRRHRWRWVRRAPAGAQAMLLAATPTRQWDGTLELRGRWSGLGGRKVATVLCGERRPSCLRHSGGRGRFRPHELRCTSCRPATTMAAAISTGCRTAGAASTGRPLSFVQPSGCPRAAAARCGDLCCADVSGAGEVAADRAGAGCALWRASPPVAVGCHGRLILAAGPRWGGGKAERAGRFPRVL